jgi:hypothetical protein
MATGLIQPSFTGGEWSPSTYGRVDLAKYQTALKTCKNFIVRQYGGVSNRPGTTLVSEVKDSSKAVRIIPFEFSNIQTYILEFGHLYMRVHKDGATVYNGGNPVEIVTPWTESDLPLLAYTQSADVLTVCHPSYRPREITRTSHISWSCDTKVNYGGPFQEINTNTNITMTTNGVVGNVTITANTPSFSSANVGQLLYLEQMPDDTTPRWEVAKAYSAGTTVRAGSHFYYTAAGGTSGTIKPTVTEGSESDGVVLWEYLHSGSGIVEITGYTSPTVVTAKVAKRLPAPLIGTYGASKTITAAAANISGQLRITSTAHGVATGTTITVTLYYDITLYRTLYDVDGYPYEEAYTQTQEFKKTAGCYVVDANTIDLPVAFPPNDWTTLKSGSINGSTATGKPSYKWAFEAWGGNQGYPSAIGYHDQRQVFGGSNGQPQTVWFSSVGGYNDFSTSLPILDDEGITFTLASREVNEVRHFLPLSELVLLTSGGEWLIKGDQTGSILPSAINVKAQGYGGASRLAPIVVGSTALYVQEKGSQVRALGYSFEQDAFIGNDLTVLSNHMFRGRTLVSWAFQKIPFSVAWTIRDDGKLLGLTYLREQEVIGWHIHETDGYFESVASISENNEDAVYFVVRRTINGATKRFIERLDSRFFDNVKDCKFLDCSLSYDGTNQTAKTITITGGTLWDHTETLTLTASASTFAAGDVGDTIMYENGGVVYRLTITSYTSATVVHAIPNRTVPAEYRSARTDWIFGRNQFAGLSHLEGKTVGILADGNVMPQAVVASGTITLDNAYGKVHIGLPYVADFETLPMSVPGQNVLDKKKLINKVTLLCEESRGIFAGPDVNNLVEYKQRSTENYDEAIVPASGLFEIITPSRWDKNGSFVVRQSDPLPLSILAAIPEVSVGG